MLYITEKAASMVVLSAQSGGCEGLDLRVSYHGEQVGPARYRMGFDTQREGDVVWQCQEIKVLVATESCQPLEHMVLDFQDLPGSGPQFVFLHLR